MMSKIPNDLMDDIINNLFHSNKNNFNLPIPKKSILRYIYELSKSGNSFLRSTQPHISLTSENSNNELKIEINSLTEDYIININDIKLKTNYYYKLDNKYTFFD